MYIIENSRMGSKVGVAAMLGPANLHILCDISKFVELTKLGGCQLQLVPAKVEVILRSSEVKLCTFFQVCRNPTKLGGCRLQLVPTKVEVILRSSEVKLCAFFQVCRISIKLDGCVLHLVPTKVEVILRSNYAHFFKFVGFQ